MSTVPPPLPLSVEQAVSEGIGYLAFIHLGIRLPLRVRQSASGYYVGTHDDEGPASRESVEYFDSFTDANLALATGHWQQRLSP